MDEVRHLITFWNREWPFNSRGRGGLTRITT
jgi:hypothetical protein